MIMVNNTEKGDFSEVIALIDHVYGKENNPTKMEDIVTDLLCKDNMEHMRIMKAEGKPVSIINYIIMKLISTVTVKDAVMVFQYTAVKVI